MICHSKLLQTRWLKITKICFFPVQQPVCHMPCCLWRLHGESVFLQTSWPLVTTNRGQASITQEFLPALLWHGVSLCIYLCSELHPCRWAYISNLQLLSMIKSTKTQFLLIIILQILHRHKIGEDQLNSVYYSCLDNQAKYYHKFSFLNFKLLHHLHVPIYLTFPFPYNMDNASFRTEGFQQSKSYHFVEKQEIITTFK